jgi:Icc-related predicted phosphoesterase
MRIYVFADLHGNTKALAKMKKAVKESQPDLVICLGDLTVFEHEMEPLLSRLNMLKVPVIMLHGNHEDEARMRKACDRFERITFLHKEFIKKKGYTFAAYGGGGFDDDYPELEKLIKQKKWKALEWRKVVFLSHAPPYNTNLDDVGELDEEWHVGSKTLRKLMKSKKPLLVLAGHIHDCFNTADEIGGRPCENPGPSGKLYDLKELEKNY